MCVIVKLIPGQMIPKDMLWNAVYNNWHSYGLVTKIDGKLDITKKVPESGEVDPQEVHDLLERDIAYTRILHLRHNTAGATTMDNTHPFDIYYSKRKGKEKQILFMHNGTFDEYKSKKKNNIGTMVDDDDGPSDTKNFVDQILIPIISGSNYGNGPGDIEDELLKKVLRGVWPSGYNRGLLISNHQKDLSFGDWKLIKPKQGDTDTHFMASNDHYFDKVIRGPEFKRREEAAKKNNNKASSSSKGVANLRDFSIEAKHEFYDLSESVSDILCDWDFWDRDHAISLGYATMDELAELYDASKDDTITVMDWIFTDYAVMYEELAETKDKKDRGTKKIAELLCEIKELKETIKQEEKKVG